ncbi:hypothetical protein THOM_2507 [Trachipleistophora hominis]|uniref:Uncharacterized protein n=1 Tax=Trachipleistophora hominis TaxID=72359 RepID=L7JSZ0_TRAHO|nr:hypothetical protein THOM_2507 [Trachipleistophora hominis]
MPWKDEDPIAFFIKPTEQSIDLSIRGKPRRHKFCKKHFFYPRQKGDVSAVQGQGNKYESMK